MYTQSQSAHIPNSSITIIIPCFNEENYIEQTIQKIFAWRDARSFRVQIIVVDDGSTDNTVIKLKKIINDRDSIILQHKKNKGKGASIRTALKDSTGDIILIQDADCEYDPSDYDELLTPILSGESDVVYGSRFLGRKHNRSLYPAYAIGNKLVTWFCNLVCGLKLTDMETGYKIMKRTHLLQSELKEDRFGIEPELTCKLSKIKGIRIKEVPIAYYGRSFKEGKKIRWSDGAYAFFCILRYKFFK